MKVVVTGGAGFIGANTVAALVAEPVVDHVVVLDDLSSGTETSLAGLAGLANVEFVCGSVVDAPLVRHVITGASSVVHLAARPSVPGSVADPIGTHAVNATGTLEVLEAARRAGGVHTIVASSAAVYGDDPTAKKHERLVPRPLSPYAADKLASEASTAAYAASYGLPAIVFRFFNVFGPLQAPDHAYAAAVPALASAALNHRTLTIHGDGLQTRDFVFVGDVARLLVTAVLHQVTANGAVNLATGSSRTLLDLIAVLEEILGRPLPRAHTPTRPGDIRNSGADQHELRRLFPDLEPIPFSDALRATVEWLEGRSIARHTQDPANDAGAHRR